MCEMEVRIQGGIALAPILRKLERGEEVERQRGRRRCRKMAWQAGNRQAWDYWAYGNLRPLATYTIMTWL